MPRIRSKTASGCIYLLVQILISSQVWISFESDKILLDIQCFRDVSMLHQNICSEYEIILSSSKYLKYAIKQIKQAVVKY